MESKEVIKVLDALGDKLGVSVDWTSDNVAPYLQELMGKCIKYTLWNSVVLLIISSTMIIITLYICTRVRYTYKLNIEDCLTMFFVAAFPIIFFLTLFLWQVDNIIGCMIFPEKIFYDMIQNLL